MTNGAWLDERVLLHGRQHGKAGQGSFTAPEGPWTLEIIVDSEGLIWEIDETNNVWSRTVSDSSSVSAATVMLVVEALPRWSSVLLDVELVLWKKKVVAALKATEKQSGPAAAKPPAQPPTKRRGPPGGKVATSSSKSPSRGPPRGPQKPPRPRPRPRHKNSQRSTWLRSAQWNHRHLHSKNGLKTTPNSRVVVNTNTLRKQRTMSDQPVADGF